MLFSPILCFGARRLCLKRINKRQAATKQTCEGNWVCFGNASNAGNGRSSAYCLAESPGKLCLLDREKVTAH